MRPFSGQGEIPYRRYAAFVLRARERLVAKRLFARRVSRSGERPEPTVKVRMKENARAGPPERRIGPHVIALGDVSVTKEIAVTHARIRFVDANGQAAIAGQPLVSVVPLLPARPARFCSPPGGSDLRPDAGTRFPAALNAQAFQRENHG
jgi:hypothetical protein